MNKKKITNLVFHHREMAEGFLKNLIKQGATPKSFSGVMCPKFGNFVFIWQFQNNKLVGSTAIHVNNIENLSNKLIQSSKSNDWFETEGGNNESIGDDDDSAS